MTSFARLPMNGPDETVKLLGPVDIPTSRAAVRSAAAVSNNVRLTSAVPMTTPLIEQTTQAAAMTLELRT
jgi:hypothetical protein